MEGLFKGKLVHESFDCPVTLRDAFKDECKQNGSSVCKELQKYELSYIVSSRIKKHAFGNTFSKLANIPVTIGNLNLHTYVQSRVRRYGPQEQEVMLSKCAYCGKPAVGRFRWNKSGKIYELCSFHSEEFVDDKTWECV